MSVLATDQRAESQATRLLGVDSLCIMSRVAGRSRTIVAGLDLTVGEGETVGIVGESGSGKSLTARALIGLLPAGVFATGSAEYLGVNVIDSTERRLRSLRGTEIGLVLQDPFTMLNPVMKCGVQITEMLRGADGKRLSRSERKREAVRRLAEVGINDSGAADKYPFQLSGGMRQRVGIAAALARDPRLLIADEPSTGLDVTTQKEILQLLKTLQTARGMGLILISHDLRIAFSMCDRIYVLYAGSVLEVGAAGLMEAEPLHPYTLGLLLSEPPIDGRLARLEAIGGALPEHDEVRSMCSFAPRCRWATTECKTRRPDLVQVDSGRQSACRRISTIRPELTAFRGRSRVAGEVVEHVAVESPILSIDGVSKLFRSPGQAKAEFAALDNVSLQVGAGESVGLVGESGSGKTTLGRCIVGLETPSSGEIAIDGIAVNDFNAISPEARRHVRRTVQMIFQDPYSSLNPVRTVGSMLGEALSLAKEKNLTVSDLLRNVGLPENYARRKPVALSGGERQRVAIARALAVGPRVIVCDEVVSALDVSIQAQILNLFANLREELGLAYLFISHDLAVIRQVVGRVYVMRRGVVVEEGLVDDILDRPTHPYTRELIDSIPRSERKVG